MQLRDYQEKFVVNIAQALTKHKRIVASLATGGGKSICFAAISDRYIRKSGKSVLILVHRKELLKQAVKTLWRACEIHAQIVVAGMKTVPSAPVYVAMVETAYRRLDKFRNIGLVIVDECHLGNFTKVIDYFTDQYIIGFTATPLAAKKTEPLNKYFDNIVCGIDIAELIEQGHLCREITYGSKETVDRAELKMKMGEFDQGDMSDKFSNPKYVKSTVAAYKKYSSGRKTIIFNCGVDHSKKVCSEFLSEGFDCKHLDADSADRDKILEWFDVTPDAVLCNVGIAGVGFDQPDIETVIINKATASMPMFLQMAGRGGRQHEVKKAFTIIDLGGNCITHGHWSQKRNWTEIFRNPPRKGSGVAPVKECPNCEALIPASCRICPECDFEFPLKDPRPEYVSEFLLLSNSIDVQKIIDENNQYKEYYSFYRISRDLALQAKATIPKMDDLTFADILERNLTLGKQWTKAKRKRFYDWHREQILLTLDKEILKLYPKFRRAIPEPEPYKSVNT